MRKKLQLHKLTVSTIETAAAALHTWEVSPLEGSAGFKFIFSAHMNAMELKLVVGTEKMCMLHEPAGFWPNIFLNIFSGAFKSHYPVA